MQLSLAAGWLCSANNAHPQTDLCELSRRLHTSMSEDGELNAASVRHHLWGLKLNFLQVIWNRWRDDALRHSFLLLVWFLLLLFLRSNSLYWSSSEQIGLVIPLDSMSFFHRIKFFQPTLNWKNHIIPSIKKQNYLNRLQKYSHEHIKHWRHTKYWM